MGWQTHASVVEKDLSFGPPFPTCTNGETSYYYGDAKYIGLGFSVLSFLVVIEMYGSIFMKNCNVILALLFGYFVAGVSKDTFVDQDNIESAPAITFLWVYTFPISFYAPAVIPLLIAYLVTTVETIGDLTGKYDAFLFSITHRALSF